MKRPRRTIGPLTATASFSRAAAAPDDARYVLRLYVTGMTQRSTRAIANAKAICEKHLAGRYDLEVIDVYQQPVLVRQDQIVAIPTLIKELPRPLRRIVGDLADTEKILLALDVKRQT